MNYGMTIPCDNCPFRKIGGIRLTEYRVLEIAQSDGEFPCHKTCNYDNDDGEGVSTNTSKFCAGFLIFREKLEQPNQMMRIAERLRIYNAKPVIESPVRDEVFDSIEEMLEVNADCG